MPFALSVAGLSVQGVAEIVGELEDAYRAAFGTNVDLEADSPFAQEIGIYAEREANIQAQVLTVYQSFSSQSAKGVALDARAAETATFRKPATRSKSSSFQATSSGALTLDNGDRFQLIETQDEWEVIGGPYTISGAGTLAFTAQAVETGPNVFQTTGPSGWTILTTKPTWVSVESTADIDPEDTGSSVELDSALRARRKDELLINGNDIDAIRAEVGALTGVTAVAVFDNTSCVSVVDGIDPGAFEVVVDGGVDEDIAEAIFDNKPPGAESFGSTGPFTQTTVEGQQIDIFFTRPTDINVDVAITVVTTGAEYPFPVNGETLIETAVLAAMNADASIGRDIFPTKYITTCFQAVQTADGQDTIVSATVTMRVGADPFAADPIEIEIRERADFDSANTTVTVV